MASWLLHAISANPEAALAFLASMTHARPSWFCGKSLAVNTETAQGPASGPPSWGSLCHTTQWVAGGNFFLDCNLPGCTRRAAQEPPLLRSSSLSGFLPPPLQGHPGAGHSPVSAIILSSPVSLPRVIELLLPPLELGTLSLEIQKPRINIYINQ